jgi:N4-(beta-N-acetylglucosaminyl)-L-asparaginase
VRIVKRNPKTARKSRSDFAIDRRGEVGAYALQKGFSYAVCDAKAGRTLPAASVY